MSSGIDIDVSGWNRYTLKLNEQLEPTIRECLEAVHSIIESDVILFVSGPYNPSGKGPGTGGIPIPKVTRKLFESIKTIDKKDEILIGSQGSIAPHNIFVHYGTKKMAARRFIQEPFQSDKNLKKSYDVCNEIFAKNIKKITG